MATTRTTGITVLADGRATTINRSLEVLRTILNRAALSYRDPTVAPTSKPWPPPGNYVSFDLSSPGG